jgi:hypothetical protein
MSKVAISGNASGTGVFTIASPNSNTDRTLNLPDASGTVVVTGTTPALNGITFPATQSASSNANTLDDYEEGTWIPTIFFGSTQAVASTSTGWYVKVGALVTVTVQVALASQNGGVGSFEVRNFPFSNATGNEGVRGGAAIGYYNGFSGIAPYLMLAQGSTAATFRIGNGVDFNNTNVGIGSSFWFSYSYISL